MQIEKWYIIRDKDNYKEVNNYMDKIYNFKAATFSRSQGVVCFPKRNTGACTMNDDFDVLAIREGYVEIDTGYFRQHILQIPSEDSKEIINNSYSIF